MTYKGFEVSDELIDKYVESLEISITEACDLILEEQGKVKNADAEKVVDELTAKSGRRYEQSDKPRKKAEKVRKVDETKGHLLDEVSALMEDLGAVIIARKTETETTFTYEGATYTFKLTKHRPPKKQAVAP